MGALKYDIASDQIEGAFGERVGVPLEVSASPVEYGFAGMMFDAESGLYHTPNRAYMPGVGRWLTQDTIGFEGGDANLYRYVGNSSLSYIDSTGENRVLSAAIVAVATAITIFFPNDTPKPAIADPVPAQPPLYGPPEPTHPTFGDKPLNICKS